MVQIKAKAKRTGLKWPDWTPLSYQCSNGEPGITGRPPFCKRVSDKMKRNIIIIVQIVLLLMMHAPVAIAAPTLRLDKDTGLPGDTVTASGKTAPGSWVPIKILDETSNILLFDTGKADEEGNYSIQFMIPQKASGALTVVVGEGSNVANAIINGQNKPGQPGGGAPGGGGTPQITPEPVISATGSAPMEPSAGGTVSLGSEAAIDIPPHALQGTEKVEVKVERVSAIPEVPAGFRIAGTVYEFSVGGQKGYSFAEDVTITLTFDPKQLKPGETPAVYYYDENKQQWINLGGTISGNSITVKVNHFTRFAVMVQEKSEKPVLADISGHWAEDSIKALIAAGAIEGYPDGTFKPDKTITRAEFATILVKAFALEPQRGKVFADTEQHWARESIATAAYYGIVNGYDASTFGPDDIITREQLAVMIVKAAQLTPVMSELSFADSTSISSWARESLSTAVAKGVMNGYPDNTIRPQGTTTRAEAAKAIVSGLQVR